MYVGSNLTIQGQLKSFSTLVCCFCLYRESASPRGACVAVLHAEQPVSE